MGDVARIAGVHKATASRALNPATVGRVHAETARRVKEAATALGYRPNMNARGLRMRSTSSIGVLIPNVLSQLYPPLIRGVEQILRDHDHFALIADSENDPDREKLALDNLISRQVDGLIAAAHRTGRPSLQAVAAAGTPVVFLEDADDLGPASIVALDMASGVDALTDLLVDAGHTRLAHIASPATGGDAAERSALHVAALVRRGFAPDALLQVVAKDFTVDGGHGAATRLLAEHPEVTAVMAYNDLIAIGTLRAAHEAGLRVPTDLTVTGFNDVPLVAELTPPLTTVRLDMTQLGREATEVLMAAIAGDPTPQRRLLPVTLVPRGSHGPPRARP